MNDSYSEWNYSSIVKEEPTSILELVCVLTSCTGPEEWDVSSYTKRHAHKDFRAWQWLYLIHKWFPSLLGTSFLNPCLKSFPLLIANSERLGVGGYIWQQSLKGSQLKCVTWGRTTLPQKYPGPSTSRKACKRPPTSDVEPWNCTYPDSKQEFDER